MQDQIEMELHFLFRTDAAIFAILSKVRYQKPFVI